MLLKPSQTGLPSSDRFTGENRRIEGLTPNCVVLFLLLSPLLYTRRMISRRAAKLIALAYRAHFKTNTSRNNIYTLQQKELTDFFFENEYEYSFLKIVRDLARSDSSERLVAGIMDIHTGETLAPATRGSSDEQRQQLGQSLLHKMAQDILILYDEIPLRFITNGNTVQVARDLEDVRWVSTYERPAAEVLLQMLNRLQIDGFIYKERHLYPIESAVIDVVEVSTYLEKLVDTIPIQEQAVIKHHIQESERGFGEGRWGNSISDARNFFEAILLQIARAHSRKSTGADLTERNKQAWAVRDYLLDVGLLDRHEKEAVAKVYGLVSNSGSHPNIAEQDQARLMRHVALTLSQFVLLKYQSFLTNNP